MKVPAPFTLALLVLPACPTPTQDCSESKPCGPGLVCVANACVADGECGGDSGNLLENPGFECGDPPTGWFTQGGDVSSRSEGPKSGSRLARLSAPSGGAAASLWTEDDAVVAPGKDTYCARAWVRGTAAAGRITLRKVVPGGVEDENYSTPLSTDWVLLPPASYGPLKVVGNGEQKFLFRIWIPSPKAGDWMEIDDVELWRSTDGSCKDR